MHLGGVHSTVDDPSVGFGGFNQAEDIALVHLVAEEVVDVSPLVAFVEEFVEVVVVGLELAGVPVEPLSGVDLAVEHEVVTSTAVCLFGEYRSAEHLLCYFCCCCEWFRTTLDIFFV